MAEDFVSRTEFEEFKEETRHKLEGYGDVLHEIDKKVDSIIAKLEVSNDAEKTEKNLTEKIVDLKLKPIENQVDKLESAKTWLVRLILGSIVGLVLEVVFVVKSLKEAGLI